MENKHLTSQEREALLTQEGAYSAVMGYLMAERGKIAPAVFNKHVAELGYMKMNRDDLIDFAKVMDEDEVLSSLYNKAKARTIKLDEIPNGAGGTADLTESDLFSLVTNYLVDNEDNNARLREMRYLQRKGVYMKQLMDGLKKYLKEEFQGMPREKYLQTPTPKLEKGDKSIILCFSDWHIGVTVVNEDTGGYNFQKLQTSVKDIIDEVLALIDEYEVTKLYVLNLGDFTEHINLRNTNQAFDAEFNLAQQISKSVRFTVDILRQLSKRVHVVYGQVSGNHDRLQTSKGDTISGDTTAYILLDLLIDTVQGDLGQLSNVTILDNRNDVYSLELEVAGKNIKAVHGDKEPKNGDNKIHKHIKDRPIDILYMGHYHHTGIKQEDYARFTILVGSPQGANDYSKSFTLPQTFGSQMITILEEGKVSPMFYPIMLRNGRVI